MTVELQKSGVTGPFWLEELLKAIMHGDSSTEKYDG